MRKTIILLITFSFFIPTIAEGVERVSIIEDKEAQLFIDNDSIKHISQKKFRVRIKISIKSLSHSVNLVGLNIVKWEHIAPETVGFEIYNYLCKNGK